MVNFYISAVTYGYMTIDQVPVIYQDEVKAALGIE